MKERMKNTSKIWKRQKRNNGRRDRRKIERMHKGKKEDRLKTKGKTKGGTEARP